MKIIHYLNHTVQGNGHVAVAVDLACEQARLGNEVYMVSGAGNFDELLTQHGVKVVRVDEFLGRLRVLQMARQLLSVVRRIRPDIINAHMVAAALSARLLQPFFGFKLVTTVHNSFDRQSSLMKVGNRVIVVSDAVGEDMSSRGVPRKKLRTVTNGTIGGVRRPSEVAPPEPLERPAVVTICGLHTRKGVDVLIDAFDMARKDCPEAHLYLVGWGPTEQDFKDQARRTESADNIHFLGFRPDPRVVLASADVFVLASLRDPCPLVIFEAREMGVPIIASAVDGIPAALADGRRGVLVPPSDRKVLSEEISRVLSDERLRERLGGAAKEDLESITVARMSRETVAVYTELLAASE